MYMYSTYDICCVYMFCVICLFICCAVFFR